MALYLHIISHYILKTIKFHPKIILRSTGNYKNTAWVVIFSSYLRQSQSSKVYYLQQSSSKAGVCPTTKACLVNPQWTKLILWRLNTDRQTWLCTVQNTGTIPSMTLFHSSYWPVLGSTSSPHTMVLNGHISCNLPTKMNQNLTLIISATTWFQFIQPWRLRQHVPSKCQCHPLTLHGIHGIKTQETRAWTIPHHEILQTYNTNWLCII